MKNINMLDGILIILRGNSNSNDFNYKDANMYIQSLKKLVLGLFKQPKDVIRVPSTFS